METPVSQLAISPEIRCNPDSTLGCTKVTGPQHSSPFTLHGILPLGYYQPMNSNSSYPVRIVHNFAAPPEAVFDAWLNPQVMRHWMFVSPTNEIREVRTDPQIGGSFSILERTESGDEIDHYGEYREIDRPNRLVFTLQVPKHFPGESSVVVDIKATPGGCEMTFTQSGVKKEITEGPWRAMFDTLATILGKSK
jgi:uncharacterized protein YndB with AHSA1/START domain